MTFRMALSNDLDSLDRYGFFLGAGTGLLACAMSLFGSLESTDFYSLVGVGLGLLGLGFVLARKRGKEASV